MTLSEVPLDTLNRFAAEKLGISHRHTVSHDEQQAEQSDLCDLCGVARHSHDSGMRDYTQPAGMKMLLERFPYEKLFIVIGPTSACDKWGKHLHITDVNKLGRALLESFCEAHDFQVEGA